MEKAVKTKGTFPPRLRALIHDYKTRFKTKLPTSAYRAVANSKSSLMDLQDRVSRALLAGQPDKEWERELQQARETPEAERSIEQQIDATQPSVKPKPMAPDELKSFTRRIVNVMKGNLSSKPPS